jgi:hypothetical protein
MQRETVKLLKNSSFAAYIKKLKLTAFEITAAQILLKENGRENMMQYLQGIEKQRELDSLKK